jgi:hypothetical protein
LSASPDAQAGVASHPRGANREERCEHPLPLRAATTDPLLYPRSVCVAHVLRHVCSSAVGGGIAETTTVLVDFSGFVTPKTVKAAKTAKNTIAGIRAIHHMTLAEGEAQLRRFTALDEGMLVVKTQRPQDRPPHCAPPTCAISPIPQHVHQPSCGVRCR